MVETLGIFSGTFDPPHLGHMILAAEALNQFQLTRVLWVLTPQPPHKLERPITALHHRFEMLTRAIGDIPEFELSTVEIDRAGPHFSLDTIQLLQTRYPTARLVWLIGSDLLSSLPSWKGSHDLLKMVYAIAVTHRFGNDLDLAALENNLPGITDKLRFFETPQVEISSSNIRQRILSGEHYRFYLPAKVYDYIQQNQPYHEKIVKHQSLDRSIST